MSGKTRRADRDSFEPLPNFEAYRASVSKRIWAGFVVLTALLGFAAVVIFQPRGELANARVALRKAETGARESGALLKSALSDKQQMMKEFAAQGFLIAESMRDEELARSELAALASGKETEKKRAAKLAAEVETLRERLAKANLAKDAATRELKTLKRAKDQADHALKKAKGKGPALKKAKTQVVKLRQALNHTRARLQDAVAEMERLRSAARPYRATRSTLDHTLGQVEQ